MMMEKSSHWRTAPESVTVYNAAFDVTPAELIDGIITEAGIFEPSRLPRTSAVGADNRLP